MLDNARHARSNFEKGEVMEAATDSLDDSAREFQSMIQSLLSGASLEAYSTEREAFNKWFEYQKVMASEVVVEIWQLYVGGSAGGSLYGRHLYDRANANATEQKILYKALTKEEYAAPYQSSATMGQILSEKDNLINDLTQAYSMIANADIGLSLDHNADELNEFISRDWTLFQQWMSARDSLQRSLEGEVRNIFASQTGFWIDLYHHCYVLD